MRPEDFIYKEAYKQFRSHGFADRESETVAADAIRRWKRSGGGIKAVSDAVAYGKKVHAKPARSK